MFTLHEVEELAKEFSGKFSEDCYSCQTVMAMFVGWLVAKRDLEKLAERLKVELDALESNR